MRILRRQIPHDTRGGTAATEFALTIPLLLLLALGAMDFGRISHYAEVVGNAARVGAERGASQRFTDFMRSNWETSIRESVIEEMHSLPDFDEGQLEYKLAVNDEPSGVLQVAVEVAYPFTTIVAWPLLPTEVRLQRRVQYRQFR